MTVVSKSGRSIYRANWEVRREIDEELKSSLDSVRVKSITLSAKPADVQAFSGTFALALSLKDVPDSTIKVRDQGNTIHELGVDAAIELFQAYFSEIQRKRELSWDLKDRNVNMEQFDIERSKFANT